MTVTRPPAGPGGEPKGPLRVDARGLLGSLSREFRQAASSALCERLAYWLSEVAPSGIVALFASLPSEPDNEALARCLVGRTAYPRLTPEGLDFVVARPDQLRRGAAGVLEPPEGPAVSPAVVLVPGLLFTLAGDRLGRGGGYYDRALAQRRCHTVACCFHAQLVQRLPTEAHDVRMDWVCTEALGPARTNEGR